MTEEEMLELKDLYDELWKNAKTLVLDMSESINMYMVSGILILFLVFLSFPIAFASITTIIVAKAGLIDYAWATFGVLATMYFVWLGARLLRVHRRLKQRYAKLLELEKTIGD